MLSICIHDNLSFNGFKRIKINDCSSRLMVNLGPAEMFICCLVTLSIMSRGQKFPLPDTDRLGNIINFS